MRYLKNILDDYDAIIMLYHNHKYDADWDQETEQRMALFDLILANK